MITELKAGFTRSPNHFIFVFRVLLINSVELDMYLWREQPKPLAVWSLPNKVGLDGDRAEDIYQQRAFHFSGKDDLFFFSFSKESYVRANK